MEEQNIPNESVIEETPKPASRGRYKLWIRLVALLLVVSILLSLTSVDFSLLRYKDTDQMVAAQYLMDSTSYLGESRIQRLRSLLTKVDSFSINLQAAEIAIGKTDYDRAASFLTKCIPMSPTDEQTAELYSRLGCVYMLSSEPTQAQQAFDNSILLDSAKPTPYLLRAQLCYQSGDIAGATQDAVKYLELGGEDREMLSVAASICELGADLESAVRITTKKILLASDETEAAKDFAERGRLQYLLGLENEAATDVLEAKKRNIGVLTGVHYAIIGLYEYNTGDYASSSADFLKAARLSQDSNAQYYEQAILCGYLSENYDFIKQTIAEAKERSMMTTSSLLIEGILLFSEEKYAEAETALTASIDSGTVLTGAYYYRGLSRLASEQYALAAEDFTEALNWEQNTTGCIFNRAICYFALQEDEKAIEDLQYVVEHDTEGSLAGSAKELLETIEND